MKRKADVLTTVTLGIVASSQSEEYQFDSEIKRCDVDSSQECEDDDSSYAIQESQRASKQARTGHYNNSKKNNKAHHASEKTSLLQAPQQLQTIGLLHTSITSMARQVSATQKQSVQLCCFGQSILQEIAHEQGENNQEILLDALECKLQDEAQREGQRTNMYKLLRLIDEPCYLTHRRKVSKWIKDVCKEREQKFCTFAHTVHIMDKFMAELIPRKIKIEHYQLAACASLLIASKYNEADENCLKVSTLVDYTENTYTVQQMHTMEETILNTLGWSVKFDTLDSLLVPVLCLENEKCAQTRAAIVALIASFVEEAMLNVQLLEQYPISMIACAAVFAARQFVVLQGWTSSLEQITTYKESTLLPCAAILLCMHNGKFRDNAVIAHEFPHGS